MFSPLGQHARYHPNAMFCDRERHRVAVARSYSTHVVMWASSRWNAELGSRKSRGVGCTAYAPRRHHCEHGHGAVNVMKAAVLRGLRCWCGIGGLVRRQTHHVALAKVFPLLQGLYIHSPPHLSSSPLYYHPLCRTPYFPTFLLLLSTSSLYYHSLSWTPSPRNVNCDSFDSNSDNAAF